MKEMSHGAFLNVVEQGGRESAMVQAFIVYRFSLYHVLHLDYKNHLVNLHGNNGFESCTNHAVCGFHKNFKSQDFRYIQ
jgi:hypothetical protein